MFVVPKPEGSKPENRFEFKITRKTYSIPFMQYISTEGSDYVDSLAENPVTEIKMIRGILGIECPEASEELKHLTNDQVLALFTAWNENSTATVGESSASEGS